MSKPSLATWAVTRNLPSDTAVAADLTNELVEAMCEREWSPRDVFRVQLAFDEAMVNAIRHGNRFDPNKTVAVEIRCNCETVEISIADQGSGFDPSTVPDPRDEELLEVPGGRGVLLISELMTNVQYNDIGNQVTLTKIKGAAADEDDDDEEE